MKCCVIFYHKNAQSIYPKKWIEECVESIKGQSYEDFDVIELNYGGGEERYCEGMKGKYIFLNTPLENHIYAMNYLYDLAFEYGYDVVFNTNMDDCYHWNRFTIQLKAIVQGTQLVSSNWVYIDGNGKAGKVFNYCKRDLETELNKGHNIIAHPVIAMHRSFWEDGLRYNEAMLGHEDMDLWKRAVSAGKKFYIIDNYLLFYRIHSNQVTKTHTS